MKAATDNTGTMGVLGFNYTLFKHSNSLGLACRPLSANPFWEASKGNVRRQRRRDKPVLQLGIMGKGQLRRGTYNDPLSLARQKGGLMLSSNHQAYGSCSNMGSSPLGPRPH